MITASPRYSPVRVTIAVSKVRPTTHSSQHDRTLDQALEYSSAHDLPTSFVVVDDVARSSLAACPAGCRFTPPAAQVLAGRAQSPVWQGDDRPGS